MDSLAYNSGVYVADLVITLMIVGFLFAVIYGLYYIIKGVGEKKINIVYLKFGRVSDYNYLCVQI